MAGCLSIATESTAEVDQVPIVRQDDAWRGRNDSFGSAIALLDDVDGDGVRDIAVGADTAIIPDPKRGSWFRGAAAVYSGKSGQCLRSWVGPAEGGGFASSLANVSLGGAPRLLVGSGGANGRLLLLDIQNGRVALRIEKGGRRIHTDGPLASVPDMDGDGTREILCGMSELLREVPGSALRAERAGGFFVFSGRTGEPHCSVLGEEPEEQLGLSVAVVGDLDLDGVDDFVVGGSAGDGEGVIRAYSGRSAELLYARCGRDLATEGMGTQIAPLGDIDSDGVPDMITVGGFDSWPERPIPVVLISGRKGTRIEGRVDPAGIGGRARRVAGGLDGNGDGTPDFVLGYGNFGAPDRASCGIVTLQSGFDGHEVWRFEGQRSGDRTGTTLCVVGDADADGVPDIAVGVRCTSDRGGEVIVLSGRTGRFLFELGN